MSTFGALVGSIIAGLAYTLSRRNYAVTFSLSALPAVGALLLVTTVCSIAKPEFAAPRRGAGGAALLLWGTLITRGEGRVGRGG